ncbi:hypothetical protein GW17_00037948 [Ensete ventricosum]|nr:hypothetical protein GW17_00037948 [Ensete ventricosum]
MEGALGSSSTSQRLARQISGREEMPRLGSAASYCKKVGSGGVPDVTSDQVNSVVDFAIPLLRRGAGAFIVSATGRFVPEVLTIPIAYHAIVLHHTFRGPCNETHVLLPVVVACRPCPPYPC